MTNIRGPAPWPRLQVNLSVIRRHYAYANRHIPRERCHALFVAIRDIPALIAEIERFWVIACQTCQRYADLRAAALACIAASGAGEPDPFFYLRDELCAGSPQQIVKRGRR